MSAQAAAAEVSPLEPTPVGRCQHCRLFAWQRERARDAGDAVTVANMNDQLRRHPHRRFSDWRAK
ncbi:hypothetical protein [Streptomyces antimicrobicus]|uniref:Uracil-DNA glycosylase n=1 Tax=Streptomyces antimicrobicus TaxID=2883108 RepID=A0ABS8B4I6_9ACTN|nr:hypothetical protein [Streptomyces antimicrobicus]MCB5179519.1 hypothetical protein [Streptomyces antimicrobicus]